MLKAFNENLIAVVDCYQFIYNNQDQNDFLQEVIKNIFLN